MNTLISSLRRALLGVLLVIAPASGIAAEYTVAVATIGSSKEWSNPSLWLPDTGSIPGAADTIYYDAPSQVVGIRIDTAFLEVGRIVTRGESSYTRGFYGKEGLSSTLKIGTLEHTGGGVLNLRNTGTTARLSVEISELIVGSGNTVAIGQDYTPDQPGLTLDGFTVTGTTTASGEIRFDAVKARVAGENVIDLGHLILSGGEVALGGRGNSGGILKVRSLTGGSTSRIYVYRNNSAYKGLTGTVEIQSGAGTVSTYEGRLRDVYSDSESQQHAEAHLTVRKTGAGTQILSGTDNKYSGGTFIEGGVLAITNGSGSGLGFGKVVVSGSGTLAGSGRVALVNETIEIQSGGTLFPSAHLSNGGATLTINGGQTLTGALLSLESGANLWFRLGSDKIRFTNWHEGGLQLAPEGIILNALDIAAERFTLFEFDAISSVELELLAEQLSAQTLGATFDGWQATFGYSTEGTNTLWIELAAIPEPGSAAFVSSRCWRVRRGDANGGWPTAGFRHWASLYCTWA